MTVRSSKTKGCISRSFFYVAILIFLFSNFCKAQASSQPIPPFEMRLSNNKVFAAKNLSKGIATILIYFDPECEHCQKLLEDFFKQVNKFKKSQIVMVTFKTVHELAQFEQVYNIKKYPNIKAGTEGESFFLRMYYGITTLPFVALYDKKGNLSYYYKNEPSVSDLIVRLKKIQ